MWGIVNLTPRYPACIVEQAVTAAMARGLWSYKAVRRLAEQLLALAVAHSDPAQLDLLTKPSILTQQHELIRDPAEYAAFFEHSTVPPQGE